MATLQSGNQSNKSNVITKVDFSFNHQGAISVGCQIQIYRSNESKWTRHQAADHASESNWLIQWKSGSYRNRIQVVCVWQCCRLLKKSSFTMPQCLLLYICILMLESCMVTDFHYWLYYRLYNRLYYGLFILKVSNKVNNKVCNKVNNESQ